MYTHGMYSGRRGVIMMVAWACQKVSTTGSAMKITSLAVPAMSAATQASRLLRPARTAWISASAAQMMMTYSPIRNVGWLAHCSAGLVNVFQGRSGDTSHGSVLTVGTSAQYLTSCSSSRPAPASPRSRWPRPPKTSGP